MFLYETLCELNIRYVLISKYYGQLRISCIPLFIVGEKLFFKTIILYSVHLLFIFLKILVFTARNSFLQQINYRIISGSRENWETEIKGINKLKNSYRIYEDLSQRVLRFFYCCFLTTVLWVFSNLLVKYFSVDQKQSHEAYRCQ